MFRKLFLFSLIVTVFGVKCPVCIGPSCLANNIPELECEGDQGVFYQSSRVQNQSEHQCLHLVYKIPADDLVVNWRRCIRTSFVTQTFCQNLLNYPGLNVNECVLQEALPSGVTATSASLFLLAATLFCYLL